MCDPVSLTIAAVGAIGGAALSSTMKPPSMPAPQAPPTPSTPQAGRSPVTTTIGAGSAAGTGGFGFGTLGNTMLTGARGAVPSPTQLGGTTLLGG